MSPKVDHSLHSSYASVGDRILSQTDFDRDDLQSSIEIFETESIRSGKPLPRRLDVIALVSGLSFSDVLQSELQAVQDELSNYLDGVNHYWVEKERLAVEYFVFKWPGDEYSAEIEAKALEACERVPLDAYDLSISGIQIHPDGCIVARGFDSGSVLRNSRIFLREFDCRFPKKQSNWAHIPLGRILEPLGSKRFNLLKNKVKDISSRFYLTERVSDAKLVFESRWYMLEYKVLHTKTLSQ